MSPPIFDFEGSLAFAAKIVAYADTVRANSDARSGARNAAHDAWQGPYGDDHRTRAEDEDAAAEATAEAMVQCGRDWAMAWQSAAVEMNEFAYDEAVKIQEDLNDRRMTAWSYAYRRWASDPDRTDSPPRAPVLGTVEYPEGVDVPASPAFTVSELPFAHYELVGTTTEVTYQSGPPY